MSGLPPGASGHRVPAKERLGQSESRRNDNMKPMTAMHLNAVTGTGKTERAAYYTAQLVGWGIYAAFLILLSPVSGMAEAFAIAGLWCGCGLLGTHVLRTYVNRHPQLTTVQLAARFAVAIVLIPTLMVTSQTLAYGALRTGGLHAGGVVAHFFQAVLVISLWCALYYGAHESRRRRAAEMEALRLELVAQVAQFHTLRSQLNPHFLFNCLNSLRELVDEDRDRAKQAITRLSDLLRYTLHADRVETVSLKEELAAVEDYLALEKIRFEERLSLRYEIAPEALSAKIPPMLLQTLAENGLKHGISKLPAGGELSITASVNDSNLRIEVTNSGNVAETNGSTAIGLENARERLRLVYGDRATLTLDTDGGQKVHAVATIPLSR